VVAKPVRLRRTAADDLETAVDQLLDEATSDVAARFVDAVELALRHVGRHPHSGSLRFSYDLDIPELRAWPLTRFPYLVFYVDDDDEIDVWRILHTRRDIPAALAENDGEQRDAPPPGTPAALDPQCGASGRREPWARGGRRTY
jgi:toxin ParE1/3/4